MFALDVKRVSCANLRPQLRYMTDCKDTSYAGEMFYNYTVRSYHIEQYFIDIL